MARKGRIIRSAEDRRLGACSALTSFQNLVGTMFAGHEVASLLYARAAAYIKKFFWSDMVEEWNARDRNPSRQTKQNELSLLVLLVSSAIGREFFCKALGRIAAGDPGVRRAREAASIEGTRRRDVEKVVGKVREERRDEAREDLEIERNLILSQAVDALAERRGINRLNSTLQEHDVTRRGDCDVRGVRKQCATSHPKTHTCVSRVRTSVVDDYRRRRTHRAAHASRG